MENTPRNVIIQLGSLIALYVSISFFLTLVFGMINLIYPDAADAYYEIEGSSDSVRLGIAMVVVFFPAFITLTRITHVVKRQEKESEYTMLTRWLLYISLLVAGLTLLGTLVTVLYTFLNGDLTSRFFMKAGAVLCVVGLSFHYYLLEVKGYWIKHESRSFMFAVGISLVVLMTLAFGLRHIDTPATVRDMKIDEQQVNDLRQLQYQIQNSLIENSSSTVASIITQLDLSSTNTPALREPYTAEATATGFKLCATFSRDYTDPNTLTSPIDPTSRIKNADNWNYKAGRYCFERVVK